MKKLFLSIFLFISCNAFDSDNLYKGMVLDQMCVNILEQPKYILHIKLYSAFIKDKLSVSLWEKVCKKIMKPEFDLPEEIVGLLKEKGLITLDGDVDPDISEWLKKEIDELNDNNFVDKFSIKINNFAHTLGNNLNFKIAFFADLLTRLNIDSAIHIFNKLNKNTYNLPRDVIDYFDYINITDKNLLLQLSEFFKQAKAIVDQQYSVDDEPGQEERKER